MRYRITGVRSDIVEADYFTVSKEFIVLYNRKNLTRLQRAFLFFGNPDTVVACFPSSDHTITTIKD